MTWTLPISTLRLVLVILLPLVLLSPPTSVLGQDAQIIEVKSQEPATTPGNVFPDDIETEANQWIEKLLVGASIDIRSKFVGKFFGSDPNDPRSWTATIIAASEAFRDEAQGWDRFTLTITTNFTPGDKGAKRRQTLINVDDYLFRGRSNSAVPSSTWAYREVASKEALKRRTQIAWTLGNMAKKLSGKTLGKISLSPISTNI
jgi:hypothetical protein